MQRKRGCEGNLVGAGRTYDLEFDALSIEFNGTDLEVDTDGRDERGRPCVIAETEEQTRLSNTWNTGLLRRQLCVQIQKHLSLRSRAAGEGR